MESHQNITTNTNSSTHQLTESTAIVTLSVNITNNFFINNIRSICIALSTVTVWLFQISFVLFDTDESEVVKIIMTLRNDCATGIDKILYSFIKKFKLYLIPPLT